MPDLGPHAVYIVWSYVGVAIGVLGLIAWAVLDARRVRARIAALEARGIRRRSSGAA